jgi:hypothetical protein
MIKERNEFVNIREILARVTEHPMLKHVNLEQAIRYTIEFIGIVGCPKFYCDKQEDITIEDYKGLLPCDLVSINQVLDKKSGFCMRSMTDTFQPRDYPFNSEPTFKTQGNVIFTSFKTGDITISYKAIPVDSNGIPLLINNEPFLKALELYIKKKVFTILYDVGKISGAILTNTQQEYAFAVAQCEKEFITPSVSELQAITNMWNTLIPRMTEFDNGFVELGNREYLR